MSETYDICVIGGGPSGLFALYYAGLRGMKTALFDALPQLGGQMAALYPEKYVYDVAGIPKVLAKDLAADFVSQGLQYNPDVFLNTTIADLEDAGEGVWRLRSSTGEEWLTRSVLLTVGIGAFEPRKMKADNLEDYEGKSAHYTVAERAAFKGKRLLVVGGGDSAVDWANEFAEDGCEVTLIHRRDDFRAVEANVELMTTNGVNVMTPWVLKGVDGESGQITKAIIHNKNAKETKELAVDAVLLNLGFISRLDFLDRWGIENDGKSIVVNERQATNLPGVYASGDVTTYPGKLKLIVTGVAESAKAVNFIAVHLDPSANLDPGYSTNRGH